ncbi:MAG: protein kinase [Planctomycetaceae bacterium]|nr:protein kinase [Planctomycetaceae bacterium]
MSDDPQQPIASPDSVGSSVDPQSVEGIFLAALAKDSPEEREAFLQDVCGDNADLRMRVDALLRAYQDAGSFLESPPHSPAERDLSFSFLTLSKDPSLLGLLGDYEVYEMIGQGGMGIVFRARDPKLNRVVAIKVMAPELAANPNARRRFIREAQAAAAVSHPHVVTIHAVEDSTQLPFLVMECIVGQSLQQKLDKVGALRLAEILRISKQIADGRSAAHRQGLIHRDIKPANILLENGVERVKITDFGLARAVDDVSVTRTGEVTGTPQYMSPEQAMGERVDHRSDLFSLGCVMYAMCTGRSPFRSTSFAAAIKRVCHDDPRPIGEINAELPDWLMATVYKLLAKDPEQRYQSADELAHELEARLAGVQMPTPTYPQRRAESLGPTSAWDDAKSMGKQAATRLQHGLAEASEQATAQIPRWTMLLAAIIGGVIGLGFVDRFDWEFAFTLFGLMVFGAISLIWMVRQQQQSSPPAETPSARLRENMFQIGAALGIGSLALMTGSVIQMGPLRAGAFVPAVMIGWIVTILLLASSRFTSHENQQSRSDTVRPMPLHWKLSLLLSGLAAFLIVVSIAVMVLIDISSSRYLRDREQQARRQDEAVSQPESFEVIPEQPNASPTEMGGLIVQLTEPELSLLVVPVSEQDDRTNELPFHTFEVFRSETKQHLVGTYDILQRDYLYGWLDGKQEVPGIGGSEDDTMMSGYGGDMYGESEFSGMEYMMGSGYPGSYAAGPSGSSVPAYYPAGTVTITAGEFQAIQAKRSMELIRNNSPHCQEGQFYRLLWNGQVFTLSADQARTVDLVMAVGEKDGSSISERKLLDTFHENFPERPEYANIAAIFNNGKHPAYGHLLKHTHGDPSSNGQRYQLAPIGESETSEEEASAPPPHSLAETPSGTGAPGGEILPNIAADRPPRREISGASFIVSGPGFQSNAGTLTLDVRDPGMTVAVRKASVFDPNVFSEEEVVQGVGTTSWNVKAGEYEFLVLNKLFGWERETFRKSVPASDQTNVVVDFDWKRMADDSNFETLRLSPEMFYWNGTAFGPIKDFAPRLVIDILLDHASSAEMEVDEQTILKALRSSLQTHLRDLPSIEAAFEGQLKQGTYGKLIVPGEQEGTVRLAPRKLKTLTIDLQSPGISATVEYPRVNGLFGGFRSVYEFGKNDLEMFPGESSVYKVSMSDQLVGWRSNFGEMFGGAETVQVVLGEGNATSVSFQRDWNRIADAAPDGNATFQWFSGRSVSGGGFGGGYGGSNLTNQQKLVVVRLLRGLADGEPDVSEKELLQELKIDGDRTLDDIFNGLDSGESSSWKGLLAPGETPDTWRLTPPTPEQIGKDEWKRIYEKKSDSSESN